MRDKPGQPKSADEMRRIEETWRRWTRGHGREPGLPRPQDARRWNDTTSYARDLDERRGR